jgi:hypothetical protein
VVSAPVLNSWGPRYILIQTEGFCGFPQSLQANASTVPLHYAVILINLVTHT